MSAQGPVTQAPKRSRRDQGRTAGLIALAVLFTLFAVLNLEKVSVDWIIGTTRTPLIIVIAVSLLVGIVLTHFAGRRAAKRR
jgi:lipopolysaccharide assembly protein A